MSKLLHDIKHASRVIGREKVFSATVILTLGLCIGANAAIFTIVNAVVLRPLPFAAADRLVHVSNSYPRAGVVEASNSVPDYYDRKAGVAAFEDVAIYRNQGRTIGTHAGAERVEVMEATPSLLRLLGARALRGRIFAEQDGEPGLHHKVILTDGFWQQHFGGGDEAIGQTIRLDGTPHTVVGVLPQDYVFVDSQVRIWIPTAFAPRDRGESRRHSNSFQMIARLRPGATLAQAQQQIDAINGAQLERSPIRQPLIDAGYTTRAVMFQDRLVRDVRGTLYLLWAGVGVVLLIGVVNVTNLTLVRAAARAREFATRQALGAGAWQLMRQLLTEAMMLTACAGVLGVAIGYGVVRATTAGVGDRIPRAFEIGVDATTMLLTFAVTLVIGALIALLPLVNVRRVSLAQAVREEGRSGTTGVHARMMRQTLVTAQVAFAFMLLIGAGLLLASFRAVLNVDPGFDPRGVLTGRVRLPATRYEKDEQVVSTVERLRERVRAIPGVTAVGFGSSAPFSESYSDSVIFAEGYTPKAGESVISPARNLVTPGYFSALRIPVNRGRPIDERDTATSQRVIVVDAQLAHKFWPGQDPVGKRMYQPDSSEGVGKGPGPDTKWLIVVGVVGEVKQRGLAGGDERIGAYYFPQAQNASRSLTLVARTATDPESVAKSIRRELATIDAELPFYSVLTMEERVQASLAGRRTAMLLAVGFGIIALMLATIGIYGVLSYHVAQRTREIGIRMALGSDASSVFAMILREGAALLGVGFTLGLAGACGMRQAIARELFGVDAMEPTVLGTVAALLAVVALLACALPAHRASRIDPVIALTA
jgi:predicted permease